MDEGIEKKFDSLRRY